LSAPTSIRRLQLHYLAIYAVLGATSPYLPVYLREAKGLMPGEIGTIFATGEAVVLIMPMLMTYAVDRHRWVRPLLVFLFALNMVAMTALIGAVGFWFCLIGAALNRLSGQPQLSLGDGLYFTLQAEAAPDQPTPPFARVRVWGSIGFILPSLVIYAGYQFGGGLNWMPYVAGACAILGLINAFGLPRRLSVLVPTAQRLPTFDAARTLFRRPLGLFCIGIGLLTSANMALYGFYPLYLTQQVGLDERWLGIASSLGVTLEIVYMLNLERMRRRVGFGGLIALGAAANIARFACLGFLPSPTLAVTVQVLHGMVIVGLMVAPIMYLNTFAQSGFRNSLQGVYVVLVIGLSSIAGNWVSGQLAEISLLTLFRVAAGVSLAGLICIGLSFRLRRSPPLGSTRAHPIRRSASPDPPP
jgi:MFS transporter, PPP family, 3-phenylpropionic acid transporter